MAVPTIQAKERREAAGPGGWAPGLADALLDLVFPPGCPGCGAPPEEGGVFCPECMAENLPLGRREAGCPVCGAPGEGGICRRCRENPPAFSQAWAVCLHQGPVAGAVRAFKYRRRYQTGVDLARFLAQNTPADLLDWTQVAAPVPLHPLRLLLRGFNQSLVLARGLTRNPAAIPAAAGREFRVTPRLLRRLRHTRPQVGLTPLERRGNVAGAFAPGPQGGLARGARVLLVDDVFTTGATVAECARVLMEAGAAEVRVLTLVRAGGGGKEEA